LADAAAGSAAHAARAADAPGRADAVDHPLSRVGAVVVDYNAGDHVIECVRSLRAEGVGEVVVVDNGSTDGSPEALAATDPATVVVRSVVNVGYGRGVNRGWAELGRGAAPRTSDRPATEAPVLLLVSNPDVVLRRGAVERLVAALDAAAGVGIVGPRIDNPDGTRYPSARTFPAIGDAVGHAVLGLVAPRNRFTRRYRMLDIDPDTAGEVDWVSGACFLVRAETFRDLGGFDEAYFMYLEDVDLCWRAGRAGWKVLYEPAARVVHLQGVSTDQQPYRMILAHHRSMLRFATRTTAGWRRAVLPVVVVGLVARAAVACVHRAVVGRYRRGGRRATE
jgi:N-acetylglucosaminyl-diphospho-decaprenol L-rhamnosyltransferase